MSGSCRWALWPLERDLDGDLGNDSFFFEGPSGHFDFRAPSLIAFVQVAAKVSDETWLRHLGQGNYSRWFREVLNDPVLAEEAAAFECRDDLPAAASRAGLRAAINGSTPRRSGPTPAEAVHPQPARAALGSVVQVASSAQRKSNHRLPTPLAYGGCLGDASAA